MRKISVIGIGAGNPDHITVQAIKALGQLDVVFVIDKGPEKDDLARLRRELCERYIAPRAYRMIEIPDPPRDRAPSRYEAAVEDWHERRSRLYEEAIASHLAESERGGLLVWGDPCLYDSTLRILDRILARGELAFEHEVIPGITSLQALTAAHRTTLNQIGGPVRITTGRRLREQGIGPAETVAVMLDGECAFNAVEGEDIEILWGAYVGGEKEILLSGPLAETAPEIESVRRDARDQHGWIMDAYLLRRRGEA
jgi:precorrin-6A synthase